MWRGRHRPLRSGCSVLPMPDEAPTDARLLVHVLRAVLMAAWMSGRMPRLVPLCVWLGRLRLTGVEEHWFQRVFLGQDHDLDMSMTVPPAPPAAKSSPPAGRRVPAATRSCGLPRSVHRGHHRQSRRTPPGLAETDRDAHDRGDRTARRSRRHPAGADRRRHRPVKRPGAGSAAELVRSQPHTPPSAPSGT